MELLLVRVPTQKTCTIGALFIDGATVRECFTLEDVVREVLGKPVASWKVPNKTAIPAGRYQITLHDSPKFGNAVPMLLDVPGFTYILMHAGNTSADTEGCIILGTAIGADGESVVNSRAARDALYTKIHSAIAAGAAVWITVV